MQGFKTKTLVLTLTLISVLGAAAAAEIDVGNGQSQQPLEEETVWMNHPEDQRSATLSCSGNSTLESVQLAGSNFSGVEGKEEWKLNFGPAGQSGTLKHKIEENLGDYPKTYSLDVKCNNSDSASATINAEAVDELNIQDGEGMVGSSLVEDTYLGNYDTYSNSESLNIELLKKGSSRSMEELVGASVNNFKIKGNELSLQDGDVSREVGSDEDKNRAQFRLNPHVSQYTASEIGLEIYDNSGNLVASRQINPEIHEYTYNLLENERPSRKIDFETVMGGNYEYVAQIEKETQPTDFDLVGSDFGLNVYRFEEDGWNQIYKEKEWMDWSPTPGSNENEYRIYLENKKKISSLSDGLYQFELVFKKEDPIVLDRIQVDKGTVFSGRVYDSGGTGVKTKFTFLNDLGSKEINSQSDGSYNGEIDASNYDSAKVSFHHTGRETFDTKAFLNDPKLGSETDLAGEGSAIRYHYWNEPTSQVAGVDPVNQMAMMFGYDMSGVDSIRMKFDHSKVNSQNLRVYECSFWNFEGKRCDGEWKQIDQEDFDKTFVKSPPEVQINNVELFDNPGDDKTILMNSYLLGVPAGIQLGNQFTISGPNQGEIPMNGDLTVSGSIIDENGNKVGSGHEVDIVFGDEDVVLEAQTDSNGEFEVEGKAPSETGDYEITVKSDPEGYGSLSKTFDDPLVVYKEKDISMDAPKTYSLQRGEEEEVEVKVSNPGQVELEGASLTFSGMDSSLYSASKVSLGNIPPNESESSTITVEVPDAYEDAFPSMTVSVSAQAGGEKVEDEKEIQFQANTAASSGTDNNDSQTENNAQEGDNSGTEQVDNSGSDWSMPSPSLDGMTGQFVEERSTLNLALGFVTLFLMVVAVAVKKDKESGGRGAKRDRPVSGGGSAAMSVDVSATQSSSEDYVCDETGESFDTKEGLEMYKEMKGIE